jgi:hypothetical protein
MNLVNAALGLVSGMAAGCVRVRSSSAIRDERTTLKNAGPAAWRNGGPSPRAARDPAMLGNPQERSSTRSMIVPRPSVGAVVLLRAIVLVPVTIVRCGRLFVAYFKVRLPT